MTSISDNVYSDKLSYENRKLMVGDHVRISKYMV